MSTKITLSIIKADVGSVAGHNRPHPAMLQTAQDRLAAAKAQGLLVDCYVARCGDDIDLIMTHRHGAAAPPVHQLAWDTFLACTAVAKGLKLYGAGQDLLGDAFSGNVKGLGPGVAELEMVERPSEPVVCLLADKTSPGAWNLPLYKIFADPFNTPGLVIDPKLHGGFTFSVLDVRKKAAITLATPAESYDLLMFLGAHGRYMIREIRRSADQELAAVASTDVLSEIAGKYVGKDDPVCILRAQAGLPAVGEILEPFAFPHIVQGWMRGSHHGPLMPCAMAQANPTRLDGPPRVVALGFQLNQGQLVGPIDLFDDVAFDRARAQANEIADLLRRHGPFEPHRLPLEEMEYTTLPQIMGRLADRFRPV
jgi:fructose 1,6-bisphosphate aldolase/phosphatase